MRILWFVQANFDPSKEKGGYNGAGWISSLLNVLKTVNDIQITVAFHGKTEQEYVEENVTFISMLSPRMPFVKKLFYKMKGDYIGEEEFLWDSYVDIYKNIVNKVSPDIIQIFGTENTFGLLCGKTTIPIIVHIQGITAPYHNAYFPPFISKRSQSGICRKYNSWKKMVHREKEMCKHINYYIGRTEWDYRVSKIMSPTSKYFYGSEILRSCFYKNQMDKQYPKSLVIVSTISIPLYKGYDLILKTAKILSEMGELFTWKVIGNVCPDLIEKIIGITHTEVGVELLGVKTSEEIKYELLNCTIYVHPSYIDNSPNSVCEAQMLGCTCIGTYVGGIPSLIKNGETGFLVPANDPYQLAFLIKKIYNNQQENSHIGANAKEAACKRHDKNYICKKLLNTYREIIADNKSCI